MTVDISTVFADVEVAVEPPVGREVRRNVPSAATELRGKHSTARKIADRSGQTAQQDVLLMAMDDIRFQNFGKNRSRYRIGALPTNVPRVRKHPDIEISDARSVGLAAESHETRRQKVGHVGRKLERVPFGSSDDAGRSKQGRHEVKDAHQPPASRAQAIPTGAEECGSCSSASAGSPSASAFHA